MDKVNIENLQIERQVSRGDTADVYLLTNGTLFKKATTSVFELCNLIGTSYEQKILDTRARKVGEIVSPISAVYAKRQLVGYTMENVNGINLNAYERNLTLDQRADLHQYYELYKKIEDIVMKANKEGIVIPDLCSLDNIFITKDGTLRFIDYDGMQFGPNDSSLVISTSLGDSSKYFYSRKYSTAPFRFTTELDKTSLTILMFLLVFNIDLTKIGTVNPLYNRKITLKDVFALHGITDEVFMNKIAANLSATQKGVYLQNELFRISQEFSMESFEIPYDESNEFIKKLTRR